jgi:hypothetical protein
MQGVITMGRIYLLAIAVVFFISGCGGGIVGSLPASTQDMSHIRGLWSFQYTVKYIFLDGEEPVEHEEQFSDVFTIKDNSVTYNNGVPLDWSYDGNLLRLQDIISVAFGDDTCGLKTGNGILNLRIPLSAGEDAAVITGDVNGSVNSDWCGPMVLTGTVTGSMIMR